MTLDPAVAAVRLAVRAELRTVEPGPVGVACSGGADSLALLAATVFEVRALGRRVVGVTVDHGLQDGSAERAAAVVEQMAGLGVDETVAARVRVETDGHGVEAAAREARYAVLAEVAGRFDLRCVLLGHTLDDQAETVLLGLTRGSGGRSIAGMRPRFEGFARPLLEVRRAQTEAACRAEGIVWWEDPHNADPRFTRSRVRHTVLPLLEQELGPGVTETLARTAGQLRADLEVVDAVAEARFRDLHDAATGFDVRRLREQAEAIRTRLLHRAAIEAGSPASELAFVHVRALADQVWNRTHLPKQIQLPGHVVAVRSGDTLRFERRAVEP